MPVEMHYLHSHLDYFPEHCGDYSEEQEERFHQDVSIREERYQGRRGVNFLARYCWCLKRIEGFTVYSTRNEIYKETIYSRVAYLISCNM